MKTRSRVILSAFLACALMGGLSIALLKIGRRSPTPATYPLERIAGTPLPSQEVTPVAALKPEPPSTVDSDKAIASTVVSSVTTGKLIEEEYAEAGEDPGAVYYMSRVREAIVGVDAPKYRVFMLLRPDREWVPVSR